MRLVRLPLHSALIRHALRGVLFPALFSFLTLNLAFPVAFAETNSAKSVKKTTASIKKTAAHPRKSAAAKKAPVKADAKATPPATPVAAPAPQAPKMPDWPLNDRSTPATVTWNASGLRIEAKNSSLQQILREVGTLTGTKIEGLSVDERVYGNFGPGPAREVLTHLFDGSGYNLLLIGDQGQGTPRQLILTKRGNGPTGAIPPPQPTVSADDDDVVEEPQQPQPPVVRQNQPPQDHGGPRGFGPGSNPPGQPPQYGVPPQSQAADTDD